MVRKLGLWTLAAVVSAAAAPAQPSAPVAALTVDEVIAKNLEARGGKDKIAAVQSARFTGTMTMGAGGEGMAAPLVLEWKRPNRVRMEFTLQGMTGVQAFDGKAGWALMPFLGKHEPEPMTAEELEGVADMGDLLDGPLYDYAAKGHQVELVGQEEIDGTRAYTLKLTKKNGDVVTMFLDAETFLEIRTVGKSTRRGREIEFESSQGDYRAVGGVLFPHKLEQRVKGAPGGSTIAVDKIELDIDLADSHFAMPQAEPEASEPAN